MKDLPAYLLFRGMSGAFGRLPASAVRATGQGIGRVMATRSRRRFLLAKRHMHRVLGPEADLDAATREMFASYGRYWAEVFWFRSDRKPEIVANTEVIGLDRVIEARDAKRGMIFALPHVGNWEAAAVVAEAVETPVLAVAEDLPNKRITEWFIETRRAFGIDVVLARSGVTRQLVAHLRAGGAVALLSDRDVTGRGVEVHFFGEQTRMPAGPAALADHTGAALFPVATYFDGAGYRDVVHAELEIPKLEDRSERIQAGTQQLARRHEHMIREAPTQWHLFQPNWPSDREWLERAG